MSADKSHFVAFCAFDKMGDEVRHLAGTAPVLVLLRCHYWTPRCCLMSRRDLLRLCKNEKEWSYRSCLVILQVERVLARLAILLDALMLASKSRASGGHLR